MFLNKKLEKLIDLFIFFVFFLLGNVAETQVCYISQEKCTGLVGFCWVNIR